MGASVVPANGGQAIAAEPSSTVTEDVSDIHGENDAPELPNGSEARLSEPGRRENRSDEYQQTDRRSSARGGRQSNRGNERERQSRQQHGQHHKNEETSNSTSIPLLPGEDSIEIERLRRELTNERRAHGNTRRTAQQREKDLGEALAKAEAQLEAVRVSMTAMREFVEVESVDGQTMIGRFKELIESANDLCYCVVKELDDKSLIARLNFGTILTIRDEPDIYFLLQGYLSFMQRAGASIEDVAMPVVQAIIFTTLADCVFSQFCATASHWPHFNRTALRMLKAVEKSETQERAGRWRAITYTAVRAHTDYELANILINEMEQRLRLSMEALLPFSGVSIRRILAAVRGRAHKTMLDAIQLQHFIQTKYTSCSYQIFLPCIDQTFSPTRDEVVGGQHAGLAAIVEPEHKGKVILATTLGLKATKKDEGKQKEGILVKAKVIAVL